MNVTRSLVFCIFALFSIQLVQSLDASLSTKSLSLSKNEPVKVIITDDSGKPITANKVVLLKAYPTNAEEKILLSNKDLTAAEGGYQIDFGTAKPEPGSYTLDLKITPSDNKHSPKETSLTLKVVGPVTISDTQITVSESEDSQDISSGKKHKVESGKKLDTPVKAGQSQHLLVDFKVKGQSGNILQVQQAFVKLTSSHGRELIQPAKYSTKGYSAHFSVREVANEFYGQSGNFELQIIVGDAFVSNPTAWTVGSVSFTFSNTSRVDPPADPFAKQADIKHVFRVPDKRPPKTISLAFTAAALGIPALVLFVGLIRVGANVSNFPTGANFIFAVGFQASLAAILSLFVLYWLRLNMVQTLTYLGVLALPTLFFAHRNLNGLSKVKQHAE